MIRSTRRPAFSIRLVRACAGVVLLLGLPAPAQEADAAKLIAAVGTAEAAASPTRLILAVSERRGPYLASEAPTQMRDRLVREKPIQAEGTFVALREGWVKDLVVSATLGARAPSHTRTGQSGGLLRVLVETTVGGEAQRFGRVTRVATIAPGDAVLSRQIAAGARGIQWTAHEVAGDRIRLRGVRGQERHTLELERIGSHALRRWELTRRLTGPSGEQQEQTYICEADPGGPAGSVSRLEEWVINPPPAGNVAHRVTVVRTPPGQPLPTAADLAVRFPPGTLVTDVRGEVAVEYEQTEEGVDEAQVARTAADLVKDRVGVGQPAPEFPIRNLRGKELKLADFRGKPLVLYWFSPDTARALEWARLVRELDNRYRRRGVAFLALAVGTEEKAAETAGEFRRKAGWDFPTVLDPTSEGIRRYGTVVASPKIAVLDAQGSIVYIQAGLDPDGISAVLDRILGAKRK